MTALLFDWLELVLRWPAAIVRHAETIRAQAVLSRALPPGNLTGPTEEERQTLARWIAAGAPAE